MEMLVQLGVGPHFHNTVLPAAASAAATQQGGGDGAECGAAQWPYLHCVFVPAWQLAVYSYRKATDDHIRLLDLSTGRPVPLEQTEYELRVGVPTARNDDDNFVTGLALDYSIQVGVGGEWGWVGSGDGCGVGMGEQCV
jgi:hypothetical protein